jgi:hypothetical protein
LIADVTTVTTDEQLPCLIVASSFGFFFLSPILSFAKHPMQADARNPRVLIPSHGRGDKYLHENRF